MIALRTGGLAAVTMLAACGPAQDLSEAQLSAVVARRQPELERCYQSALESHPYEQSIKMDAIIHIAESGEVERVQLEGGGGLPGMAPCIVKTIKTWTFPSAKDGTLTSLPLIFKPEVKQDTAAMQQAVEKALGAAQQQPQP